MEIKKSYNDPELSVFEKAAMFLGKGYMDKEGNIVKADNAPVDFQVGTSLIPELRDAFISRVREQNILSVFAEQGHTSTTGNIDAFASTTRNLVRPGTTNNIALADFNKLDLTNVGNTFTLEEVQLRWSLPRTSVQDNAWKRSFVSDMTNLATKQLSRDLSDLSTNGTATTGGDFLALQTGIVQKAKTYIAAGGAVACKLHDNGGDADLLETMKSMKLSLSSIYRTDDMVYQLSADDFETYKDLRDEKDITNERQSVAFAPSFKGYRVMMNPYLADGTQILTPLDNIRFEYGSEEGQVEFHASYDAELRAFKFIWNIMVDFSILNCESFVLSYDAA